MQLPGATVVERVGLMILRAGLDAGSAGAHQWSAADVRDIARLEWTAMLTAAAAGAASGGILAVVEFGLRNVFGEASGSGWRETTPYWASYLAAGAVVSGGELLYLYWTLLRKVARLGSVAGLRLTDQELDQIVARGLSRAALDLPNPREPVHGIDPYARAPKWKLAAYSLLYRLKVGATSFVLRVLLRRVLTRAAVRFVVPLAAIPVFAIWNALIAYWILREARIRAAGPFAAGQLGAAAAAARDTLDDHERRLVVQAVGETIARSHDAHPNYVLLLTRLLEALEIDPESFALDWETVRAALPASERHVQEMVLDAVTGATVLGGGGRKAMRFLAELHDECGRPFDEAAVRVLQRAFLAGRGFGDAGLGVLRTAPKASGDGESER